MGIVLTSPRPAGPHPAWSLVASLRQWRRSGSAVFGSRPESAREVGSLAAATSRVFDTGPVLPRGHAGPVPAHPYLAALGRIHRGERRRPRWVRFLERLFGVAA